MEKGSLGRLSWASHHEAGNSPWLAQEPPAHLQYQRQRRTLPCSQTQTLPQEAYEAALAYK